MFVFKAAVVGAGTMGGEIAQAIAAAEHPRRPQGHRAGVRRRRPRQGPRGHQGPARPARQEGEADPGAGRRRSSRRSWAGSPARPTTTGFGDVDFVIEAAPEKMEIKQAVFAELDAVTPGHAILASNTSSLSITEIGDATLRPDKVVGFHFFYPASVMPLVEIVARRRHLARDDRGRASTSPRRSASSRSSARRCPGFVVNRILNSAVGEIWRAQEEQGLSIKKIDEGVGAPNVAPMGPFFLVDLLGLDTVLHVAEHLNESYGDRFYVHQGMKKLVDEGKLGAKSGGEGFYENGEPQHRGRRRARRRGARRAVVAEGAASRRCLVLEEGVCTVARDRPRDDGRRRAGPAPRPLPAVHEGRPRRGSTSMLEKLEQPRRSTASASRAPRDPAAARRAGPARPEGRPGLLRLPAARRGRPDRDRQARDARRRRDRVAGERADERDLAAGHRGPRHRLGEGQGDGRGRRDGDRLVDPGRVLGRRRHQGVHADGRGRRAPS